MTLTVFIDGVDVTAAVRSKSLSITRRLEGRASEARMVLRADRIDPEIWGEFVWGSGVWGGEGVEVQGRPILIQDETTAKRFRGEVTRVQRTKTRGSNGAAFYTISCRGVEAILTDRLVEVDFSGVSDRAAILSVLATVPEITADTSTVALLQSGLTFESEVMTVEEFLKRVTAITGGVYTLDYDYTFRYFHPVSITAPNAPIAINTEAPDGVASISATVSRGDDDFSRVKNDILVRGAVQSDGERVEGYATDGPSIASYGLRQLLITDDGIVSTLEANARAAAELARLSQPRDGGSFRVIGFDGFDVGQKVSITSSAARTFGDFLIQEITCRQLTRTKYEYEVRYGEYVPDAVETMRELSRRARSRSGTPVAIPPAGSVTADMIQGVYTSVFQGMIGADQIGAVNAGTIEGLIVSSQVADGILDSLSKFAPALRPIPRLAVAPALPSPAYPVGSHFRNATSGLYYENIADAWVEVTAGMALSGKLEYELIGKLAVERLNGLILAAQIDSVTVEQVNGTIQAGGSILVNANSVFGTFAAGAVSIHGSNIQNATIPGAALVSITQSQITDLSITDAHIVDLSGAKIQNLTIPGTKLQDGAVTDLKILTCSVSKLLAGEASFSGSATFRNGNNRLVIDGTAVQITDLTRYVRLTSGGIYVYGGGISLGAPSGTTPPLEIKSDGDIVMTKGSNVLTLNGSGLQVNGGTIGLGASTYATSPVQASSSEVSLYYGSSRRFRLTSSGASEWSVTSETFIQLAASGNTMTLRASGGILTQSIISITGTGTYMNAPEYRIGGVKVVGARQTACGDPVLSSLSPAGATYGAAEQALLNEVKERLNDLVWNYRGLLDRLGVSGHGLLADA